MEEKQFDILNHINIQMSERNYRERHDASKHVKHDSHQALASPKSDRTASKKASFHLL